MPFSCRSLSPIAHLKFDLFASQLDRLDLEVDADGGNEGGVESVVGEPEEDASLADAGVADQEQLEQEVVAFLGHFGDRFAQPSRTNGFFSNRRKTG